MPAGGPAPRVLVRAGERGAAEAFHHPYNAASEVHGWMLSRPAGLSRVAVNLYWIPPGKEPFVHHLHHREEEWLYVLEGRGIAEVDDAEHAIGPGDFLGFPPGVGHHLRNAGTERLLYLLGGEVIPDLEVGDYPRLRRRMVRCGTRYAVYPMDAEIPLFPEPVELPPEFLGIRARAAPPRVLVRVAERPEPRACPQPNSPTSEVHLTQLSRPAGLERIAVSVAKVPAEKSSFVYHVHQHDEEWMYVLSGRGIAEIGDGEEPIGPGDFLGFPAGGPAHDTRARRGEDLVYLQGGDARRPGSIEIVDFPRLALRRTFVGMRGLTFPMSAGVE